MDSFGNYGCAMLFSHWNKRDALICFQLPEGSPSQDAPLSRFILVYVSSYLGWEANLSNFLGRSWAGKAPLLQ